MARPPRPSVAVIIPAFDSAATIADAVRSALGQPETSEVLVVDDGSTDDTAARARAAARGDGRLRVVSQPNRGPAAAVNRGQAESSAPFFCILDADDYFLPGRLAALFGGLSDPDWDMAADRLLLVDEGRRGPLRPWAPRLPESGVLTFAEFVRGNISTPGAPRAELGYLQPVFRRAFLERHALQHDEAVRIGEDYLLYARALALGARFRVIRSAGYVATLRANSLSAAHRADDLEALLQADRAMLDLPLGPADREILGRHVRHVRDKLVLRRALDAKAAAGAWAGVAVALRSWVCLPYLVTETVRARLRGRSKAGAEPPRMTVGADQPVR